MVGTARLACTGSNASPDHTASAFALYTLHTTAGLCTVSPKPTTGHSMKQMDRRRRYDTPGKRTRQRDIELIFVRSCYLQITCIIPPPHALGRNVTVKVLECLAPNFGSTRDGSAVVMIRMMMIIVTASWPWRCLPPAWPPTP
jgi:hypothetical protein